MCPAIMPVPRSTANRRALLRDFALACAGYTALTLLIFHGLIGRLSTAVPHDLGDPLLSTWILWWNAHHIPFVGTWWDGLSFFPGHGSLAFSDHRVGLTLIAGPIQWLGGSPVLAYNVTLLSSFVLCALAAHALGWLVTRSHAAGAVSGLIFGFNPFRVSHIAHLELLAVFWLPLAFAALHVYVRRFEVRWLVLFAVFWLLQGLSSGYYLFYSAPVIGLWAVWFARDKLWRGVAAVMLACAAVLIALLPVLLGYKTIQDRLLLTRSSAEIESFSADITGILSATPNMALWRVPSLAANGEAEVYLGIFAPLIVLAAMFGCRGTKATDERPWPRLRIGIGVVGGIYALVAAGTFVGPWSLSIGPLTLSARQTVQPFSITVLCAIMLGLTSPTFVAAFRRHSIFAFYTTAAFMTWSFMLGPRPTLLGRQLLYRGPYAFLMWLPGFDERLRVPARFVMMTILAVAIAAGIALIRLTGSASRAVRVGVTALVLLAITADSWTFVLPMPSVPPFLRLPDEVPASAAVLELPLGNVGPDIAAVYRSIGHGRPVINGYSGYGPPHYRVLGPALGERDDSVLKTMTKFAPIAVVIAREDDRTGALSAFVREHPGAVQLEQTVSHALYLLPRDTAAHDRQADRPFEQSLVIRHATFNLGTFDLRAVTDGNRETVWATPKPQRGGEEIVLELAGLCSVSSISLSSGSSLEGFPRRLSVAISVDGTIWEEMWSGAMGGPTIEGVLQDAREAASRIAFPDRQARFVRLRQLGVHPDLGWVIAELKIYGRGESPVCTETGAVPMTRRDDREYRQCFTLGPASIGSSAGAPAPLTPASLATQPRGRGSRR
jgi:hypothetical protein